MKNQKLIIIILLGIISVLVSEVVVSMGHIKGKVITPCASSGCYAQDKLK